MQVQINDLREMGVNLATMVQTVYTQQQGHSQGTVDQRHTYGQQPRRWMERETHPHQKTHKGKVCAHRHS